MQESMADSSHLSQRTRSAYTCLTQLLANCVLPEDCYLSFLAVIDHPD